MCGGTGGLTWRAGEEGGGAHRAQVSSVTTAHRHRDTKKPTTRQTHGQDSRADTNRDMSQVHNHGIPHDVHNQAVADKSRPSLGDALELPHTNFGHDLRCEKHSFEAQP